MKQNNFQLLIDIKEASRFLTIKESQIRHLVFTKSIPVVRVGRLVRFEKDELVKWVKSLREGGRNV